MLKRLLGNILLDPDATPYNGGGAATSAVAADSADTTKVADNTPALVDNTPNPDNAPQSGDALNAPVNGDESGLGFDAFLAKAGKGFTTPDVIKPAQAGEPKIDKPVIEDKTKQPDLKTTLPDANQPLALPKISLTPTGKKARDYSDIAPEDAPLFKNMSNDAYEKMKPIYLQHKQTADTIKAKDDEITRLKAAGNSDGVLPPSYLEHEQAYTLTPAYNQNLQAATQLQAEHGFWAEQLELIKAGKGYRTLVQNQQGQVTISTQEQPYSPRAEEVVRSKMLQAQSYQQEVERNLQGLQYSHKQQVQQGLAQLKTIEKQFFPFYEDLTKMPEDKQIIEQSIKGLPAAFQSNPMAILLGKAYATCIRLQTALNEATEGKSADLNNRIQEDAKRAGPTAGKLGSAPDTSNGKQQDDNLMDKFAAMTGKRF